MNIYVYLSESDQDNPSVEVYATEEQAQTRFINDVLEDDEIIEASDGEEGDDDYFPGKDELREMIATDRPLSEIYQQAREVYEASREDGCNDTYYSFTKDSVIAKPVTLNIN